MPITAGRSALYAAFKAKDPRFDGRFFVGVSSTGIYCRPVCHAKLPRAENCTFYATAAEAEQAGHRPCLVCRPELAPGASAVDARKTLARRAASLIEAGATTDQSLAALAATLGCTGRHLRRVFMAEYRVTPVEYQQTVRLLLAKGLLTDTALPVLDVAMAAGFGSLRRFYAVFRARYRMAPTALRRAAGAAPPDGSVTLLLGYRPPYLWDRQLAFLAGRAIPGVEAVQGGAYLRTVRCVAGGAALHGWLRVAHRADQSALAVTLSTALLPALPQVLARVRLMFDLGCAPHAIYEGLASMDKIRPGLCALGTRLPGCFDPFEMAVRTVLGQQISVKAASTLAGRLVAAYGTPVDTGVEGLTHAFPTPDDMLALEGNIADHLGRLGVIGARARTILALAQGLRDGHITLGPDADPEAEVARLLAMPGIGPWTAHIIAMRAMGWPDAFLPTDLGIKKALAPRTPKESLALAEAWRPWRSYATMNLWHAPQSE